MTTRAAAVLGARRSCGTCRACCKSPSIKELDKGLDEWCSFSNPDGTSTAGCTIYADRPRVCASFRCGWLLGYGDEQDRPDRLGVLMQPTLRGNDGVLAFVEFEAGALQQPRARELMATWAAATSGKVAVRQVGERAFRAVSLTVRGQEVVVTASADELRRAG